MAMKPSIMGIINCTPDSFYPGSRAVGIDAALERARLLIDQGADSLDLGGESSRPGSDYVETAEELKRVIPVVEGIRRFSDIPLSVDTRKAAVARAALDAGAAMINDISGLRDDPEMIPLLAERGAPAVLMHMKGTPRDMQQNPFYEDVLAEVTADLKSWTRAAREGGVKKEQIIWDPGIGFGKRQGDNLTLLREIPALKKEGYPLLIGLSRKSFIGNILEVPPEERLAGTLGGHAAAALGGADILRVHDVKETREMLLVMEAVLWNS